MKTFSQKVVELAIRIPKGKVVTYGMLAKRAGSGGVASQSITGILGKAYMAGEKNIPWHRIVYAGGRIWIDDAHRTERMKLYKQKKIEIDAKGKIKNFEDKLWDFK
jgi:methylated-DNA-protein-cysteine methyltransferase-like protein